jgi:vacuolar-type H+-ATPase subunit H
MRRFSAPAVGLDAAILGGCGAGLATVSPPFIRRRSERRAIAGTIRPLTKQRFAMDVLVLIDKLDDLVHNAKPVPLTDQVRVDKEEIYDILDQMRATIPEEIKQARWIVKERQEMLAEAKREAERIVKEARDRQERMISEEEITKQAERAAEDIIEDARGREREIRLGAEDYADEILNTLEVNLSKFIAAVQRGRDRLAGKDEPAEVS